MPRGGARRDTPAMKGAVDVHRALADPTRAAILDRLREAGGEHDVLSLAVAAGVHPNTVRSHLVVLGRAGLARARTETRATPGRPRKLWSATPAPAEEEHSLLASALVDALEPLEEGPELAEQAGHAWGRRLVVGGHPGGDAVAGLTALLGARGFDPELGEDEVAMRRCPFRALAERHPRVVCGFHAGLIAGALESLDAPCRLAELRPWVTSDRCVARLAPAPR
jgi:predicted ArsR family transcriptional regulator